MKIIHCADLHLDSQMTTNLTREKAKERKAELLVTFQRMVGYARDNGVEAIIIAGDMFDSHNINTTTRNTVAEAIRRNPGITFFYLRGNHDADSFLGNLGEMPENLKLFEEQWTSYDFGKCINISGIEFDEGNSITMYDSLVLDTNKINIVVLHGQESAEQKKQQAEIINISGLKNKGIDYLALGHIHSYKCEKLDSRGQYCYPGCLEGRGFDECGEHGFVLLDIDEDNKIVNHSFVPFAMRKIYAPVVIVTGRRTSDEIAELMDAAVTAEGIEPNSLVKFILRGYVDISCEKNIDYLQKLFEERFYFVKIYDETKLKVDYDAYALDKSLKGEFVRTVQNSDLDEDTKAEVIRLGIQALLGEALE